MGGTLSPTVDSELEGAPPGLVAVGGPHTVPLCVVGWIWCWAQGSGGEDRGQAGEGRSVVRGDCVVIGTHDEVTQRLPAASVPRLLQQA